MAKGINKVVLVGNLGNDPEIRYLPSGTAVANISLATGDIKRDQKTKKIVEATDWHRVVLFGKLAELCGQYLKKGAKAGIVGKLKTRSFEDKQKVKRYVTEVIADDLTLLESKTKVDDEISSNDFIAEYDERDAFQGGDA
jgi:single-strand DNA-binding protein